MFLTTYLLIREATGVMWLFQDTTSVTLVCQLPFLVLRAASPEGHSYIYLPLVDISKYFPFLGLSCMRGSAKYSSAFRFINPLSNVYSLCIVYILQASNLNFPFSSTEMLKPAEEEASFHASWSQPRELSKPKHLSRAALLDQTI